MSIHARRMQRSSQTDTAVTSQLMQQSFGIWDGTSMTVSLPSAPSTNSCLVLIIAGNTTVVTPSGWSLRDSQLNFMGHYLYTLTGFTASSWSVTTAAGNGTWWIGEVTNASYELSASANESSANSLYATPSITPGAGSRFLIASLSSATSTSSERTMSGWLSGFNEVADTCNPIADFPMQAIATKIVSADGLSSFNTGADYSLASAGRSAIICSLVIAGGSVDDTLAPTTPTNLVATPIGNSRVDLSWTASNDNVGVDHYTVYRDSSPVGSPTTNSYSDTGLTPSTTYGYTVRSFDAAANSSALSSATNATTGSGSTPIDVLSNPSAFGWPDETNTGPTVGTVFTIVPNQLTSGTGWSYNSGSDNVRVTGNNAVLSALDIRCPVIIDSADVTIEDCIITCDGGVDDSTDVLALRNQPASGYYCARPIIRRCRLNGMLSNDHSLRARRCISDNYGLTPGVVVEYCDMSGTGNLVTVENEGIIRHNYCHGIGHRYGDHHSGLSSHGGAVSLHWFHNTLDLRDTPIDPEIYPAQPDAGGGLSTCTAIYSDFGHAQNVTVEANLIANRGYSYAASGGNHGGAYNPANPASSIKFIDNRWLLSPEAYGYIMAFNAAGPGNQWSGNVNDIDNTPVSA